MALSLANILTRVRQIVPTTTLNTELQAHILERMNYLASIDVFPFQEQDYADTVTAASWRWTTPTNFATMKSLVIYTVDSQRPLEYLDPKVFDSRFPNPSEESADEPTYYTIKIGESEIWFNCKTDIAYVIHAYFHAIPDDAADETVSQLTELAKLTLVHWAAADGFADLKEYDRSEKQEQIGNNHLAVLKRRYQLSLEVGARFMSPMEAHKLYRGY